MSDTQPIDASGESVVGKIGTVTTRIAGPDGAGEVLIRIRNGSETFLAYSDEEILRGATILVVADRGARSVDVVLFSGSL